MKVAFFYNLDNKEFLKIQIKKPVLYVKKVFIRL